MKTQIKEIPIDRYKEAIDIFSSAFTDDPLFLYAFPDEKQRIRLTKLMYEFVVLDMVPTLNLSFKGAFIAEILIGCMIYTTPESKPWNDQMADSIKRLREKAQDDRMNIIGEFAMLGGYKPEGVYIYANELSVRKEFRREGIGKALCEYLIKECGQHPAAKGILIDTANKNNVRLYEKWGWVLKSEKDFYNIKKYFMWRDK